MKSKNSDIVRFIPDSGISIGLTIKEQVKSLLDDGYFDKAESAVIGVSNKDDYDVRWSGSKFDCYAIQGAIVRELVR